MKLWVDDVREPPSQDWFWAKTAEAAKAALSYKVTEVSLDYDLGSPLCDTPACADPEANCTVCRCQCHNRYPTGDTVLDFMKASETWPKKIRIHTDNLLAKRFMEARLKNLRLNSI